ncbi:hypothetical protein [Xanthomonas citri]|uniref:hypothetical protein n=1 Tax=Xanthomonas citri TaxID=346 RepID=UPI0009C1EBD9|nr:hypothetical protein [Xanthomonas citri]AMU99154.1 hypothetical protein TP37_14500 [Xanthomonas citri pv. aurantifolii]AMV04408.1 hypothetical protein TP50_19690 [Xanthomonas citri pv. aurantifolii]TBW93225.1 hypothetical protein TP47_22015 [Xanthomonas citri pv. aurantifolii]TBW93540.1 hypothetical protein TP49_21620 [Xanthomonas citri pv. aurantifolii]TBX03423.1 hypothetical protein TP46_11125 [Xanthomonas citri pv. aurantifolii]
MQFVAAIPKPSTMACIRDDLLAMDVHLNIADDREAGRLPNSSALKTALLSRTKEGLNNET